MKLSASPRRTVTILGSLRRLSPIPASVWSVLRRGFTQCYS
jgi:hypothetical protein